MSDRHTDRQTDGWMDGRTDGINKKTGEWNDLLMDWQSDGHTDRQTQTYKQKDR
jgi:hypothetical protein